MGVLQSRISTDILTVGMSSCGASLPFAARRQALSQTCKSDKSETEIMPTDLAAALARDADAPIEVGRAAMAASVWVIFYLVALAMAHADQTVARAIELSGQY
jgi:hypothetical protein